MTDHNANEITHDLKLSVLTGPVTFIVPVVAYLFLYPIILSHSSLEILGIWSLYVTTVSFFTIADLGFSQHFIRESGKDRDQNILNILKVELISANRFYLLLGLTGMIFITIFRNELFGSVKDIYSLTGLYVSALILVLSSTLQLISSLNAAILSARADNYYVKLVKSVSPVFTYSFAIAGALIKLPIEGFAVGSLIANSFLILIYRNRIKKKHQNWYLLKISLSINKTFHILKDLLKKGWKLYSISVGMLLRQPVLRYVIAFSLGLPVAGIFDIAMRITSTSRDVMSSGFGSLYPSLSYFFRNNDRSKILEIIRKSLMILLPVGFIITAILIYNAGFLYKLWLGKIPAGSISAIGILAIWQLMTILNIPFWFLLQAAHQEKIAAIAIWAHTFFILFLIPAKVIKIGISLDQLLIYWTIAAIFTQILIYIFVEKKLSLFFEVFKDGVLVKIILLTLFYFCIQIISQNVFRGFINSQVLSILLAFIFLLILLPYFLPIIKKYLFTKRSGE
ncbi:hypothetical protein LJE86_05665 [bacterium BMS3Abin03]|nr:hypothetical protein [bacterium BMS3Abin03]MCG6958946.1 hypothetical protein [bacterium BMS3Abin03]